MRTRHLAGGTALSVLLATASLLGVTATPAAADSATAVATAEDTANVTEAATTLTVNAPTSALPGAEITVTGTLGSTEPFT
ncbi:hypothetical protein ACFV3E_04125, partial [Streptomyces sp. NPDC059718]